MDRFKSIPKNKLSDLPKTAGVYAFKAGRELLYIGKAINIQNRVKNHFNQPSYRDNLFMDKVDRVGYLETGSEIEALILEANLIKKYQPRFNVVWKDGKNYFYVAVEKNKSGVPYVFITHQPKSSGSPSSANFIGPFVEGTALKKTLRFLRHAFPYYTSKKHPKLKCTYCHLDLCPGPELFENPPSPKASAGLREYRRNIKKLILILKGKRTTVLNSLKKEMKVLSKENKFEEAGRIRDSINNLQQVMSHTRVINGSAEIVVNLSSDKFTTISPTQGIGKTLGKIIGAGKNIHKIECYDVSNIQGKFATGSMVVFIDGAPAKSQYKKFRIKMENKPNDIAMLKEILQRRLTHKEWQYPDVILIDGGIAQLNVAVSVKNILAPGIKIISIAKRNKDLYIEGRSDFVPLKNLPREIYNLVLQLDDEAHRFAINYHKKLRKKSLLQ